MEWLERVLGRPQVYEATQWLWYRRGQQLKYIREWVKPRPGDRILDIGCGPAAILDYLPDVRYVGYDPNPRYVSFAKSRFGSRGDFRCGLLTEVPASERQAFDLVLANGVMHHLSDAELSATVALAHEGLKPGGRLVTRDGCLEADQSWLVRLLLSNDRGAFVRSQAGYETQLRTCFATLRAEIVRDALRLPYSLLHFEATKAPAAAGY
jgi:SAM-dependent methyltransferase